LRAAADAEGRTSSGNSAYGGRVCRARAGRAKRRERFGRALRVRSKGVRCLSWAEAPLRLCFGMPEAVALAMLRGLE